MTEKFHHQHHNQFRPSPGNEEIRRLYVDEQRGVDWLMSHFHTHIHCVRRWLLEAGVQIRKPGQRPRKRVNPAEVARLYSESGMNTLEIAKALGIGTRSVRDALVASGTKIHKPGQRPLKVKKPKIGAGYTLVYCPDHPNSGKDGYIREHRLVMSRHIGRPLADDEIVHHKDHNRSNNSIENLELLPSASNHRTLHAKEDYERRSLADVSTQELESLHLAMSTVQMAKVLGVSPATVQRELHGRGLAVAPRGVRPSKGLRLHALVEPTSIDHQPQEPGVSGLCA